MLTEAIQKVEEFYPGASEQLLNLQWATNNAVAISAGVQAPKTPEVAPQSPPDVQAAFAQYYAAKENQEHLMRREAKAETEIDKKQEALDRLRHNLTIIKDSLAIQTTDIEERLQCITEASEVHRKFFQKQGGGQDARTHRKTSTS